MEIDATATLAYAAALSANSDVRVTVTHVVGRAVAAAMRAVPAFNARVLFGRAVPYPRVDVGFTVDLDAGSGLAPATIRGADTRSTLEIARELTERAGRVRAGADRGLATSDRWVRIAPAFLAPVALRFASLWIGGLGRSAFGQRGFPLGGALVSNVGGLGLDEAMLAPWPPARCSLYLCIGAVRERPVVVDGAVTVRPVLVLTATADHRLVDGVHAARLAQFLRTALADPAALDASR